MRRMALIAVIPPFHSAVDRAISYLDPVQGLLGVTDFFVSAKYDLPLRQMIWARRFFWRCVPLGRRGPGLRVSDSGLLRLHTVPSLTGV